MTEDLLMLWKNLPYLLQGSLITIILVLGALAMGFLIGLPLAIGQIYGKKIIKRIISFYVWFFRGLPVLVLLFLFYFGLFSIFKLNLDALPAAILVLGLRSAAYQSQIFRGSMESISEGQMMAAHSMGMSTRKAILYIILPQALRLSIPGWSNEYCILLKDSAVTYAIGVYEILTRGNFISTRTYKPMPIFLLCALIFIILTFCGIQVLNFIEKRTKIPGFEHKGG